jgi:hypothetical protein
MIKPEAAPKTKFYAVVYEMDRRYGGPEEGGWWYDTGTLVHSETTFTKEFAHFRARRLLETDFKSTGDSSRVNYRGGDYSAWVEDSPPAEYFPTERPHYE